MRINTTAVKQSLALAWPISLQSILINMLALVDVAMVSHLGDAAVGAVGLGNRFLFVLNVIVLGIAWTAGVLSAQYFGAGRIDKVRATIAIAIAFAFTALTPFLIANFFIADNIMSLGSTNPEVIKLGEHYLWLTVPSLFFIAVAQCFDNSLRSLGQTKLPLVLSGSAIFINIILNYWFINGGLGVPALGVTGAAFATLCARLIHVSLIFIIIFSRNHVLKLKRADIAVFKNFKEVHKFISLAAPMMMSFALWAFGTFVYQIIYGRMGTEELAVMSILTPFEGFYTALFFGLASACSITIGQHLGANRFDDAWACAKTYAIVNPILALILGVSVVFIVDILFVPFTGLSESALSSARNVFIYISLFTWLKVINITMAMGVLRAGGDNKVCMYIDAIGMWTISIPLSFFAAFYLQWPLLFVVMVTLSEELTKAILFTWRTSKRHWLKNLT